MMNRYLAAAIHFAISVAVGTALLALMWFVWYPSPLFKAVGGDVLFMVLLSVDVTIGPLLTLVVFNPLKKSLKFDLAVIALLQVGALCFGVWTLFAGRPVYVAALGIRFDVIQASQVVDSDLEAANTSLPLLGPQWVGIREATDAKERERVFESSLSGVDYGQMPQYHAPIENMAKSLLNHAEPIADLRVRNPERRDEVDEWLRLRDIKEDDVRFLGLKARAQDMAVIIDAKTARVVGVAPFTPWR